ncbi:MAG: hypothetical protein F9K43_30130, partial [Bauldia sp.]
MSIIDVDAGTTVAAVATGAYPRGLCMSPDGTSVYIANVRDGTVSIIDTATRADPGPRDARRPLRLRHQPGHRGRAGQHRLGDRGREWRRQRQRRLHLHRQHRRRHCARDRRCHPIRRAHPLRQQEPERHHLPAVIDRHWGGGGTPQRRLRP